MRFKRYRKRGYYKNSTRVIRMKFQSFMDISTDVDSMKIITISAGGQELLNRLRPQFAAYKYYKIGNISIKLVPASTLPVDPTGLAYGVDQFVDPRDQLSPGLMRITNGEDVFEDITGLTDDEQHGIYNAMMLDPRWFKWMLQSGVKRHGTPRYWQIGQLHQDKYPGAFLNLPFIKNGGLEDTAMARQSIINGVPGVSESAIRGSSMYGIFQTGHRGVLGWLPTDSLQPYLLETGESGSGSMASDPLLASPPEIEMFKLILPKAFKTRYYYRAYISETVYFKEPVMQSPNIYRSLDVFHTQPLPVPTLPSTGDATADVTPNNVTGGNYGSD